MRRELLECLNMMKRIGAMNECVYDRILLNEGADVNSRNNAIKLFNETTKCGEDYAKLFVKNTLRDNVTSLKNNKCAKFTLGVTRLYLEGQFDFGDNVAINKLNTILYFLPTRNDIVIDSNFNRMNLQQLFDKFYNDAVASQENSENGVAQTQDAPNSIYTIVKIPEFEDAEQYSQYVDWCITQDSNMYNHYTSDGTGIFYFCLRNDFEKYGRPEEEEPGENKPLDDYGLSMLAVCVDVEGNYKSCTCRWNHHWGGNDKVLNEKQISNLIQQDFHKVFRPRFTPEEFEQKQKEIISRDDSEAEGIDRIQNGLGQYNFINEQGKLLSPKMWFSDCGYFSEGFALVSLKGRWNFIDTDGRLLSPHIWFDNARYFENGFAIVSVDGKGCNYIDRNGKLLSPVWFDYPYPFKNGFAKVYVNDKGYNYLNKEGNLLSSVWFNYVYPFSRQWARVELDGKWNYIDQNGNLVFSWFDMD